VSGGDNFSGKVEVFSQVVDTFISERVVIVLPRELGLDVTAGVQRLTSLDNFQVGDLKGRVTGEVVVLFGNQNTFLEKVFVDDFSVLLRDQHIGF
jgi:hypothetical protein